jgi:ParB-like chromosome segregation protein Spo0J
MIPVAQLVRMHDNANIMSGDDLSDLIKRIELRGFDQILTVFWNEELKLYEITKGNHRFEAGKALGLTEFPCAVGKYPNRDEAVADSIADNVTRGELQQDLLSRNINNLIGKHGRAKVEDMLMIKNKRTLKQIIKVVREQLPLEMRESFDKAKSDIQDIEDLAGVVQKIASERGHTQEIGYIFFNFEGKNHLMITMEKRTETQVRRVTDFCEAGKVNINKVLQRAVDMWMGENQLPLVENGEANVGTN